MSPGLGGLSTRLLLLSVYHQTLTIRSKPLLCKKASNYHVRLIVHFPQPLMIWISRACQGNFTFSPKSLNLSWTSDSIYIDSQSICLSIYYEKWAQRSENMYMSLSRDQRLKKAAMVPQIAMADPMNMTAASNNPHVPSSFTLAAMGPTMERENAEKDPKNAIITLNSGI